MKFIFSYKKPDRDRLWGMSASQFKTLLKRQGFKVDRDFFKMGATAQLGNRLYRFRYWAWPDFFVDISCPLNEFDRWANSTDRTINFHNFLEEHRA
ncbi:MAG: hypothetical protein EB049_05705 [Actinobacteria bacterium]|nr:hypothetical protein [Actinomycetota bacterium]